MRNLVRFVIIGAIVVAALTVIFIFLLHNPAQKTSDIIVFVSGQATDVRSVTVSNEHGDFHFYFDFEEGGYVTDDIPPYLVDLDAFAEFMTHSAQLTALRVIPSDTSDASLTGDASRSEGSPLQESGVNSPLASVQIEFFNGSKFALAIGAMERVSGNYYALVSGTSNEVSRSADIESSGNDVYIIPRSLAQQFLLPKTQIITKHLTPQLMLSSPLSAIRDITFEGGGLSKPVVIRSTTGADTETALAARSFGTATHIVYGASHYQLDQACGIEIFGSLFGITGDIAGYDLSDEEFAVLGFDNPYMTIRYDMVNDMAGNLIPMLLRIVPAEDGRFYATLNDICAVFIIDRLPFIDIQFEKLPLRYFLTPMLMDLSTVTVSTPNGSYRFDIDNTNSRDPVITHNGTSNVLNVTLFRSFFRLITSASHDGTYLGVLPRPAGNALLQITYTYTSPEHPTKFSSEKQPDTLALYPGEMRRANVFVNGAGEFAMRDLFVQRVTEGLKNLILGLPIEENW